MSHLPAIFAFGMVAMCTAAPVAVRNPFWPMGYQGEMSPISADVRPKPKPKPKPEPVKPKVDGKKAGLEGQTAAKEAAVKAVEAEKAAKAAAKAEAAKPKVITSEDWRKAQRSLKFGNPALFKAEDGTIRASININGNIYVDGDLMSFTHDDVRFTWRIRGLDGKERKLKLERIRARQIEKQKNTGGGK